MITASPSLHPLEKRYRIIRNQRDYARAHGHSPERIADLQKQLETLLTCIRKHNAQVSASGLGGVTITVDLDRHHY